MAAELTIFDDGAGLQTRHAYLTNIAGTLISAATLQEPLGPGAGQAVADTYDVTVEWNGLAYDVTRTSLYGLPLEIEIGLGTTIDNGVLIPGVQLLFNALEPPLEYRFIVEVGYHAGTVVAGSTSSAKRLFAINTGDLAGLDARVGIRPDAHFTNAEPVALINALAEADLDITTPLGTYTLELVDSPDPILIEVSLNGESLGTFEPEGSEPNWWLTLPDGPVVGLWNLLTASPGQTATVTVGTGFLDFELAPDESGAPGTFGSADLVLGTMDPAESIPFWVRVESDPTREAADNPFTAQLTARITSV